MFDYIEFTRTLKHGAKEKDDEQTDQQPQTLKSPKPPSVAGQQGQPPSPRGPQQQIESSGPTKTPVKPLQPPTRRR